MKKYLNLFFIFTLVFSLAFSSLSNPIQKAEAATSTTCTSPEGYDSQLNLPCSVLQIPCPASGVYSNGEKCRAVLSGNTNVDTLTLSSNTRAKKGTVSSATKTIQTILKALGFDPGGVDGKFGKNTENAVKAYQRSRGLFADGKVGKNTVAELQKAIQLLKKFSTEPGAGSGTEGNGGGTSSGGNSGSGGTVATSCTPRQATTAPNSYQGIVNADNYFKVFVWNPTTKVISGVVMQDVGGPSFSEQVGVDMPEAGKIILNPGERIVIAQLVDSNLSRNAVMGQFSFEANGQKVFYTNGGNWQGALSKADAPSGLSGFTTNFIKNELSNNPAWTSVYQLSNNSGEPFSSGIDSPSSWISAFPNGIASNSNKKLAIYITKESGALPLCGSLLGGSCTFPYVGTGNIVNNQVDCKLPPPSSATIDPGTHICGPSNLTNVTVKCTGVYPNLTIEGEVTFSPGAAKIVPDGGVELGLSGVPEITLKSVGGSYGTKLKFAWSGVATSPLSSINGATLLPLSVGSYFGFPGGFYRNGLTSFPLNNQAFAAISAIAAKVQCTPPPITPTLDKMCTGPYPAYVLNATATFPEAVTIVGNPKLVSTPTGLELTLSATQPLNNKTKTWVNVPPSGLVPPALQYIGSLHEPLNFVLGAGDSIKYTSSGANVDIANVPINDTTLTGCEYNPPVDTLSGSCTAPDGITWPNVTYTLNVKFNRKVIVTGEPKLKIQGAVNNNGLELKYINGSGSDTLTFKYVFDPANPNAHVHDDSVGNGKVKFILTGGAEIKDENNISLNALISDPFEFTIPNTPGTSTKITCPRPNAEVIRGGVNQICTGDYPKFTDKFEVNFTEKVKITGIPTIMVDKPNGVIAKFISLALPEKKKATFEYKGVDMDSHDYEDFNGDIKFNPLTGTPTPSIVTEWSNMPVTLSGVFSPTGTACAVPNPDTLPELVSIEKFVEGAVPRLKAVATFSKPITVLGADASFKLELVSDSTKKFKKDASNPTTSNTITFVKDFDVNSTDDPGPVKFMTLPTGASIKGSTGARVPNLYTSF